MTQNTNRKHTMKKYTVKYIYGHAGCLIKAVIGNKAKKLFVPLATQSDNLTKQRDELLTHLLTNSQ